MKLFFRKYGSGKPLIILHGLFGQSDNWSTLAKKFSEQGFEVYTPDLRNHGLSPHSGEWSYEVMAEDLEEFIGDHHLEKPFIIGHSMGGKALMYFELLYPGMTEKIIVCDIAPKQYPPQNTEALKALLSIDLSKISSRKEAEEQMNKFALDMGTKQFLLKNLYWSESSYVPGGPSKDAEKKLQWRFNLKVISEKFDIVTRAVPEGLSHTPTLFLRGERSNYILPEDEPLIKARFPNSEIRTVQGAGHWVHAEKPKEFFEEVMRFLQA